MLAPFIIPAADVVAQHHGHSHGIGEPMNPLALVIAAASIASKEALYHWTMAVARRVKSDVLAANAWHHRTDAASSVVALVGVGGAVMGIPFVDPIGGALVSAMIIKAGLDMGLPAFRELTDASAPPEILEAVEKTLEKLKTLDDNIRGYNGLRVRKIGPFLFIDLQLLVNPWISVSHAHQLAENLRHGVFREIDGVAECSIHIDSEPHDHLARPVRPAKPTSELEAEIQQAALKGLENDVKRLSHVMTHYFKDGVAVHAEILPAREDISFREAADIARKVQDRIETVDGVKSADVHLEINEHKDL
ncbi:hypothetical protein HK104_000269 [Borealophlyctis nickersoniae]|nr:hypothetical protein HK104_000269 [Borealophlyctis nickersoniae]